MRAGECDLALLHARRLAFNGCACQPNLRWNFASTPWPRYWGSAWKSIAPRMLPMPERRMFSQAEPQVISAAWRFSISASANQHMLATECAPPRHPNAKSGSVSAPSLSTTVRPSLAAYDAAATSQLASIPEAMSAKYPSAPECSNYGAEVVTRERCARGRVVIRAYLVCLRMDNRFEHGFAWLVEHVASFDCASPRELRASDESHGAFSRFAFFSGFSRLGLVWLRSRLRTESGHDNASCKVHRSDGDPDDEHSPCVLVPMTACLEVHRHGPVELGVHCARVEQNNQWKRVS
eukprot:Amastigsp_a177469_16.p1 type:complete len:293 gc:universal Amastigsp_a177469_16:492-1370(+)